MNSLRVAVVGCGTGGAAAALFLHAAGHDVRVFERTVDPAPVGAGILLQPTGMAVLRELGVLEPVLEQGARVERLHGVTAAGRQIMDLRYGQLRPGLFGLGLHRGVLFASLWRELEARGIPVSCGVAVERAEPVAAGRSGRASPGAGRVLVDTTGKRHGPFDLVVAADGARSRLRRGCRIRRRVTRYPWGALWAIVEDPDGSYAGVLDQTYRSTTEMLGFLPTGRSPEIGRGRSMVSLFWSVHGDRVDQWRTAGLEAWKAHVIALQPRAEPLLNAVGAADEMLFASYYDVRMRRWHDDGLVLIGDAGHAMSPQLGQGANLALFDGWVLSRCLGEAPSLPAALDAYSRTRRAHLRFYGMASKALTPLYQSDRGLLARPRDLLMHPAARVGWMRTQMLGSLAGAKTGVFSTLDMSGLDPSIEPSGGG